MTHLINFGILVHKLTPSHILYEIIKPTCIQGGNESFNFGVSVLQPTTSSILYEIFKQSCILDGYDSFNSGILVHQPTTEVQNYLLGQCRPYLVYEVKLFGTLSRSIRSIERRLVTKIITRMN
jgi:hypothetical protein